MNQSISPNNPETYQLNPAIAARVRFNDQGLVPAIAQAADTGEVLTLATRRGTYYSRSRQEYWIKGATSGHTQQVESVSLDCDGDTVLLRVYQRGGACHTGDRTCFDADRLA